MYICLLSYKINRNQKEKPHTDSQVSPCILKSNHYFPETMNTHPPFHTLKYFYIVWYSLYFCFLNCSKKKKRKKQTNKQEKERKRKDKKMNLHLQKLVQSTNDNFPLGWKITWCLPYFTLMKKCLYTVCYITFKCIKDVSHGENCSESDVLPAVYPERLTVILLYCTLW